MSRRERQGAGRSHGGPHRIIFLTLGLVATADGDRRAGRRRLGRSASPPPRPTSRTSSPPTRARAPRCYAADGDAPRLHPVDILRTPVGSTAIPQTIKDATVAIEDRASTSTRASTSRASSAPRSRTSTPARRSQGGSTLTMQLIRNLYNQDRAKSFKRKIREAKLAEELENMHPGRKGKKWILDEVPQQRPVRHGRRPERGRHPGRGADLLQQAGLEAQAPRGRAARRPPAGAVAVQPVPQPERGAPAPQRRARADGRRRATSRARPRDEAMTRQLGVKPQRYYTPAARATSSTTSSRSSSTSTASTRSAAAA